MRMERERGRRVTAVLGLFTLLSVSPAAAQQPPVGGAERTIRVTGQGEVRVNPDQAEITLAVESSARTAQAAGQENARTMERVIQALVAAGVARTEIETRHYTVHPEYVHGGPREEPAEPRIRGYRAVNRVVVTTAALERVGALIDVALEAGANRVDGVSFRVRDPAAAQADALRRAVARARSDAEAIAGALGVGLGPVLDASTGTQSMPPFRARDVVLAEVRAEPTPIQPGEQTVHATVSLVFAIRDGR